MMCSGEDALAVGRGNKEWRLELHLIKSESVASGVVRDEIRQRNVFIERGGEIDGRDGWLVHY